MRKAIVCFVLCLVFCTDLMAQKTDGGLGGRTFVYGEDVKLPHPIVVDENDKRPLETILDKELAGTGIGYRITKAHVVLFKKKVVERKHTVYGYVIDAESKESLIGANVFVTDCQQGGATNAYGHFSVTVPEGKIKLRTSYIGYATDTRTISLTKDTLITIALKNNTELAEVVVESDRPETGVKSSKMSGMTVPVSQILRTPAVLGEADVIKSLHLMPGVQTGAAGQVSMSVRGGNTDQNMFLLDGMLMYNVDHVMGFESAFMADAVKNVNFHRGAFSARYGGRLSSVTDVRTKDGDMQQMHGAFSVGMLSSHVALEGPIVKDKTSFIVTVRRSYADWLLKLGGGLEDIDKLGLYFYDMNAKLNHKFSDNDRLYLSFYSGRDAINIATSRDNGYDAWACNDKTEMDIRWGNTLYHARWNHIFSPKLFANVTAGYNRFKLGSSAASRSEIALKGKRESLEALKMDFRSGIDDFSAAMDFDYHPMSQHRVRMGAQYTLHTFRPEVQSSNLQVEEAGAEGVNETFRSGNEAIRAHESAVYVEDDIRLGEQWQASAGLRAVMFATDGKVFPALEPRVSFGRTIGEGMRVKGSYTLMHQYVHKLQSSQIASPSDLWVPVTSRMKPTSANQFAVGFYHSRLTGWEFSAETFYKRMDNVVDFIDGASFAGNTKGWESKIATGKGQSYGIELNASKTAGRTTGMLNYTLSRTERWFPDGSINGGRHFPYRFDRRHVVHLLVMHQLRKNIDLSAAWNFASGALASVAKQQSEYVEPTTGEMISGPYISSRNNYRLAPTHQLDLGINFHKPTKHGERIWNISLINAYCHMNQDVLFSEVKTEMNMPAGAETLNPGTIWYSENGNLSAPTAPEVAKKRVLKQITMFPIVPSVTYTYKF